MDVHHRPTFFDFFVFAFTVASFSTLSTMLSQLKAREVTPAPGDTGNKNEAAVSQKMTVSDAERQAADRLTCDALCSLANGIKGPSAPSTHSSATAAAATPPVPAMPNSISGQPLGLHGFLYRSVAEPVAVPTPPPPPPPTTTSSAAKTVPIRCTTNKNATNTAKTSTKIKNCPKQHQLPLFLSSKFLVIDSLSFIISCVKMESWFALLFFFGESFNSFAFENVLERTINHKSRIRSSSTNPAVSSNRVR